MFDWIFSRNKEQPKNPVAAPSPAPDLNQAALPSAEPQFKKEIVKIAENIYGAIGYGMSNIYMIVVPGGKIIIDAGEGAAVAAEVRKEFDKISPDPVRGILITHCHPDHVLGISAFYEKGIPVWAHEKSHEQMDLIFGSLSQAYRERGARQFGFQLAENDHNSLAIGPRLRMDEGAAPPVVYPTNLFRGVREIAIGGVKCELHEAPGETPDHLFVWLPDQRVLFAGDNIYRAFPNLESIRGEPPRPVRRWIESLDNMRELAPEVLVLGHTEPIRGTERIQEILTAYRDAIAYVHDSVIRGANAWKSLEDMVQEIRLPEHLRDHPFLQETYGEVAQSVRGIYAGYFGSFDGNPTSLNRLHTREFARLMLPLIGVDKVRIEIDRALARGDFESAQFAAELSDMLYAKDPGDSAALESKAKALRRLAQDEINKNKRAYLLSSADTLVGIREVLGKPIVDKNSIRELPIEVVLRNFPARLRPELTKDVEMTVGFQFPDTGKDYTFYIRRGVGELAKRREAAPDLRVIANEDTLKALLAKTINPALAYATGKVKLEGGLAKLRTFRSYMIQL